MLYSEYNKYLNENCVCRHNKVYTLFFRRISEHEILVERINIHRQYRGRGYLKRIFNNLCKEFTSSIALECCYDLVPMYRHIGFFSLIETDYYREIYEMFYDPLEVTF